MYWDESKDVGAFADSNTTLFDEDPGDILDSVDSPAHGSCLTPSQLYTPANSPYIQIREDFNWISNLYGVQKN